MENARHALELVLRSEAKDIREKYVEPPYTTAFGILFLPFEGLYAEVVNAGLLEVLQRDYQVNVAGPSTMAALLNSLQMGFKTLAIQKRSGEVGSCWVPSRLVRQVRAGLSKLAFAPDRRRAAGVRRQDGPYRDGRRQRDKFGPEGAEFVVPGSC